MRIFVINPGSTSTKLALYTDGETLLWKHTISHPADEISAFAHVSDQFEYRMRAMYDAIAEAGIDPEFDAVVARGGLLQPTPGGVYLVNEAVRNDLINSRMEHACNLGGLMAEELAANCGCPAMIADPEVVDELMPEARITGLPELPHISIFHALNSKAVSRRYAESTGRRYEDLNLIIVHLGGGISVGAHCHGKVIDVNNALAGDGPFSPERAGTLPSDQLVELCFSGDYSRREVKKMLNGRGGLAAWLGTTDVADVAARAERGEQPYKRVLDAMLYSVAREVGARAVALRGKTDAIILTGGIAHNDYCVNTIRGWVDWIAPVEVRAGEDELGSLADNAYRYLTGSVKAMTYDPAAIARQNR